MIIYFCLPENEQEYVVQIGIGNDVGVVEDLVSVDARQNHHQQHIQQHRVLTSKVRSTKQRIVFAFYRKYIIQM